MREKLNINEMDYIEHYVISAGKIPKFKKNEKNKESMKEYGELCLKLPYKDMVNLLYEYDNLLNFSEKRKFSERIAEKYNLTEKQVKERMKNIKKIYKSHTGKSKVLRRLV